MGSIERLNATLAAFFLGLLVFGLIAMALVR